MSGMAKGKAKKRRRHKRGFAGYALPAALVVIVVLCIVTYRLLRLQSIQVEGTTRYHTGEIIDASGLELGASLFRIKPSAVNAKIEQSLSYVGRAQLKFELPVTVVLEVEEADVIASIKENDRYLLLSDTYKILQTNSPTPDVQAPVVTGLEAYQPKAGAALKAQNEEDLTIFKNLFEALANYELPRICEIRLDDISNLSLICEGDNQILLGGPGELDYKLEFIAEIIGRYREAGEFIGMTVNAQALDGNTTPSVSVLPSASAAQVASSSESESSAEKPADTTQEERPSDKENSDDLTGKKPQNPE